MPKKLNKKQKFIDELRAKITDVLTSPKQIKKHKFHCFRDFKIEDFQDFYNSFKDNASMENNFSDVELVVDFLEDINLISYTFSEVSTTFDYWVESRAYLKIKPNLSKTVIWGHDEKVNYCNSFDEFVDYLCELEADIQDVFYNKFK